MSPADATSVAEALMRLGASTAEAVAKALDAICPEPVERGEVAVVPGEESPFVGFDFDGGAVAVSVAYVDGVTGGNVLLMTAGGARAIAAAMGGEPAGEGEEPSELELSAVAEAANQMFAAAASATGLVLSHEVEIAPPETRRLDGEAAARDAYEATPHAVTATFRACGEPCRLVQLVPNAFVVRMTRALDEAGAEQVGGDAARSGPAAAPGDERPLSDALRDVRVRVWAELGRNRVSLGEAPELPAGAVLELDRKADDPVDLYVNGLRYASGRLVLTEEGEWALRLEEVAGRTEPAAALSARGPDPDEEGA
jgi:flagellar motor switch protein FliN